MAQRRLVLSRPELRQPPGARAEGQLVNRQSGQVHRSTFETAIAADPDWILLTTRNQSRENPRIEPGYLYGNLYSARHGSMWSDGSRRRTE